MSMLILIGALVWLATMILVVAVCVMAARGDGTTVAAARLPVADGSGLAAPHVDQPTPRLAQPL